MNAHANSLQCKSWKGKREWNTWIKTSKYFSIQTLSTKWAISPEMTRIPSITKKTKLMTFDASKLSQQQPKLRTSAILVASLWMGTFLHSCNRSTICRHLSRNQEFLNIWRYEQPDASNFNVFVCMYNVLQQSFHIAVLPLLSKFKLFLVVHKNNKNVEERHWPIPFTLSGQES